MSLILSGTDGLSDVDGTAATPAIRGTDANTGIFFPAADTIAFSKGGAEAMRIDSSGQLGIGTSSPSVKLEVAGAAKLTNGNLSVVPSTATQAAVTICTNTGGSFFAGLDNSTGSTFGVGNYSAVLYNGANTPLVMFTNGAERMRIDSSGNVGIGTTSPSNKLHVSNTVNSNTVSTQANFIDVGTTGGLLYQHRINVQGKSGAASLQMGTTDSSTSHFGGQACAFFAADTLPMYLYQGSNQPMLFATNGTERARIDSSGNLLVGATSAATSERLRVKAASVTGTAFAARFSQDNTSNGSATLIGLSVEGATWSKGAIGFVRTDSFDVGAIVFCTNSNAASGTDVSLSDELMRLTSGGNLLVGTTSALSQAGIATFVSGGNALVTQVPNAYAAFQSTNVSGTGSYYPAIFSNNGNTFSTCGYIQTSGTTTSYVTSSDYRLKEDVQPMTGALAKVALLKPVTYKWKSDETDGEGFIAHELAEVCPQAVSGEKDALKEDGSIMPQGIDTSFLVATLTAAIQEQQALITALTARITALEAK